ncbi:MAG TPA: TIGR04255 family protein [Methanosarcina sp.]|nr:TIGR04255 family protein [Methanosarcina sp.]
MKFFDPIASYNTGVIMDKSKITRENFKHNFLMTGIIRLDYSGVIDIEDKIEDLSSDLHIKGYTEYEESYISELSFKLSDPIKIETLRSVPIEEFVKNKSFKFVNPKNNNVIEITKFFLTLTIDYNNYVKFEDYISLFAGISKKLQLQQHFMKPLRIGERKISSLFITDEKIIPKYFKSPYFNTPLQISDMIDDPSELVIHNAVDTLKIEDILVNITRNISKGLLRKKEGDKEVFRLLFDIDCYSSGDPVVNIFNEDNIEKTLTRLNNLDFDLYKKSITDEFIEKLTSTEFTLDDDIIGIRSQS